MDSGISGPQVASRPDEEMPTATARGEIPTVQYTLIAVRMWKGDILIADVEKLENFGRIRNMSWKTECERSPHNPKK